MFYGILLFNVAKFGDSSLLHSIPSNDPLVKIWVSYNKGAGNTYSIVVMNKYDKTTPFTFNLDIKTPPTSSSAKSIMLRNNDPTFGLRAFKGTSLGGRDLNDKTSLYEETPLTIKDSMVTISVGSASAILVRISDVDQGKMIEEIITKSSFNVPPLGAPLPTLCKGGVKCSSAERIGSFMAVFTLLFGLLF